MTDTNKITWSCHVCGTERLDEFISTFKTDISEDFNLPSGTMFQSVRYCNDRPECRELAKTFKFFKKGQ